MHGEGCVMSSDQYESIRSRVVRLARIRLDLSDCERLEGMWRLLDEVKMLRGELEGVEPLYHVWEVESRVRSDDTPSYSGVSVGELGVSVDRWFVRLPWRGSR